jgi:hypothetical protein
VSAATRRAPQLPLKYFDDFIRVMWALLERGNVSSADGAILQHGCTCRSVALRRLQLALMPNRLGASEQNKCCRIYLSRLALESSSRVGVNPRRPVGGQLVIAASPARQTVPQTPWVALSQVIIIRYGVTRVGATQCWTPTIILTDQAIYLLQSGVALPGIL